MRSGCRLISSMAFAVGRINSSILRRLASAFTLSITGRAPVPVPTTRRRHFQGMSSSSDSGVWPKLSRNFLEAFFFALGDFAAIDHDIMVVSDSIDANGAEGEFVESHGERPLELVYASRRVQD